MTGVPYALVEQLTAALQHAQRQRQSTLPVFVGQLSLARQSAAFAMELTRERRQREQCRARTSNQQGRAAVRCAAVGLRPSCRRLTAASHLLNLPAVAVSQSSRWRDAARTLRRSGSERILWCLRIPPGPRPAEKESIRLKSQTPQQHQRALHL